MARRKGRSISWTGLLLCISIPIFSPGSPDREAKKQQAPLQYEISVTLKLVQVYVTDKDGRPVRDLGKEDFVVFDDGKPVVITEFEKHETIAPEPAGETKPAVPPAVQPAAPEAAAPASAPAMGRKLFLFLDFAYNDQKGVAASLKAALHFLDADLLPDDEVGVVSYSALRGLRVHEYLTRDHAKVRRAVADFSAKEIAGRAEEIEQLYWKAAEDDPSELKNAVKYNLNWRRQEAKSLAGNYFSALTSLAKALRLVEGEKILLFFSRGIPYSLIYGAQAGSPSLVGRPGNRSAAPGSTFDMGDTNLRPLSEEVLKELSASNCLVFSFDTRESAKIQSLFAYEETMSETEGRSAFAAEDGFQTKTDLLRDDKTTGQDSLRRLSKQTVGQYFSNISLYEKNLETVQNITGTYYVLGYSISAPKDGEFHELKVEVKRKGCKVQTQSGYFNPKPFREYTDLEKQIQLFDLALNEGAENPALKTFGLTALTYDAGAGPRLRLLSRIPQQTFQAFTGKGVEFVSLAFDDQGNPVSLQRKVADAAQLKGQELLFTSGIPLQPGRYRCRVVIRDLETGESAIGSTEANVVKPAPGKLVLYTPLLLVPAEGTAYIAASQGGRIDTPSWEKVYPFVKTNLAPATGEIPQTAGKVVVIVPVTMAELGQPSVALSAQLISMADGQSMPVAFSELARSRVGTVEVAGFEFAIDQVPPGKYQIYIHAVDKDRGAQAQTHVPFTVSAAAN